MMMRKLLRITAIVFFVIAILKCSKDQVTITEPSDDIPTPQDTIPRLPEVELRKAVFKYYGLSKHCVLGILAFVDVPGYKKWKTSLGNFDDSKTRALNTNDKIILGSVSKTFTATIILQLMEEGLIDLDASVTNYLRGITQEIMAEEYNLSNITVRQLLNHESGIADFIDIPAFTNRMLNEPSNIIYQNEILSYVVEYREPLFAPGTSFDYSSTNYLLLGKIAENLCRKHFYLILKEKICSKIGLENTHLHKFDPDEGEIAHGYYGVIDGSKIHGSYGWTAGMIVSTIAELGKFLRALVTGELFQNQSTFDLMITPGQFSSYGLGIYAQEYGYGISYGHGGKAFGYRALMVYNLEKDAVLCRCITTYGIQELPSESIISSFLDLLP